MFKFCEALLRCVRKPAEGDASAKQIDPHAKTVLLLVTNLGWAKGLIRAGATKKFQLVE